MPRPPSSHRPEVGLNVSVGAAKQLPRRETPLRIVLLGDFSGRNFLPAQPASRLADRKPILVDRDNFDQVLAKFGIRLTLPLGEPDAQVTIPLRELDDFHPDRLYQTLEVFQALRQLRSELGNPATFERAAARLRSTVSAKTPTQPETTSGAEPVPRDPASLLSQILGEAPAQPQPSPPSSGETDWNAFAQKIMEPYLSPRIDRDRQRELEASVENAVGAQMRAILHHPNFQAIEAAWRSVYFLVRRLETGSQLRISLLDISKADLAADLSSTEDLQKTGAYRLLVKRAIGAPFLPEASPSLQPWSIVVGLYPFDSGQEDVALLERMARIAQQAGAPFLAEASPRLLGCPSFSLAPDPDDWQALSGEQEKRWQALRELPEASSLGLALPRMLLRLPYGKDTASVEVPGFEEMPEGSSHEMYLWGNPAIGCAYLLAEAFSQSGWSMHPGDVLDIDRMPLHVYRADGEDQVKPSTEVILCMRAIEAILGNGLMPFVSYSGRDVVRLAGFHSLASPSAPLAGPWE